MRHVQTSESAAAASALNDDEKENEEDAATASSSAAATGGVATVSFEMKPTNKPRKANSLRRSESGGGVRPKEKLHGALESPLLLNHCDILIQGAYVGLRPGLG